MDQYPSNSKNPPRQQREEPKKITPVVQGNATRRKTPLGKRITHTMLGGDVQSVWGYVFGDVLAPAFRDMIADAVSGGVNQMLFGSDSIRGRNSRRDPRGHNDYNSISRSSRTIRREEPRGREMSRHGRSNHQFDEIVLDKRIEAEEVFDRMDALIDKYDHVSVAEFYELCGVSSDYTDRKYGWTDIRGASISRVRGGGYAMYLPPPEPID